LLVRHAGSNCVKLHHHVGCRSRVDRRAEEPVPRRNRRVLRSRLRRGSRRVERDGGQASGRDRSLCGHGGRGRIRRLRASVRSGDRGPRRGPQRLRPFLHRRRDRDRPASDAFGHGRSRRSDRDRRRRIPHPGPRCRDATVRPRHDRRDGESHGCRGAHARRGLRLPGEEIRPCLRQPPVGGVGPRRRQRRADQRVGRARAVLGHPRWRGELRDRHLVRVPAPSPRTDRLLGRAHLRGGARTGRPSSLPRPCLRAGRHRERHVHRRRVAELAGGGRVAGGSPDRDGRVRRDGAEPGRGRGDRRPAALGRTPA
jgi:hypothetical protein